MKILKIAIEIFEFVQMCKNFNEIKKTITILDIFEKHNLSSFSSANARLVHFAL